MRFDVITLFPDIIRAYLGESILKRAAGAGLILCGVHTPRDYTANPRKSVDDRAYGGGPGMVLAAEPILKTLAGIRVGKNKKEKIILFSAGGKRFDAKLAVAWAKKYERIIMIAGRYEGVDERIKKIYKMEEISVGPYVLTGGELPALTVIDAVARYIPGVLGKSGSLEEKRLGVGVPAYTRPELLEWKKKKYRVPEVLLSGNHKKIVMWRRKMRKSGVTGT